MVLSLHVGTCSLILAGGDLTGGRPGGDLLLLRPLLFLKFVVDILLQLAVLVLIIIDEAIEIVLIFWTQALQRKRRLKCGPNVIFTTDANE